MTDNPTTSPPASHNDQARVAIVIVAAMVALGVGLLVAACVLANTEAMMAGMAISGVTTIIGGLCVALNAPTGVAQALKAAKDSSQ